VKVFDYKTLDEIIVSFENAVSHQIQAKKVKLILFLRTGYEADVTF